ATVARKPVHRGERDISRKTIAQGKPDCLRWTCMLVCVFLVHLAHETAGAACIRLSLCPPLLGRVRTDAKLGRMAPRECGRAYLPIVIAREGGRSITPRLLGSSTAASGYWIVRSSR